MKSFAAGLALIAMLLAQSIVPASAQTQPAPPAAVAAVTPASSTVADDEKPSAARGKGKWLKADARVCLEFPTTMQIIKCTEKYR